MDPQDARGAQGDLDVEAFGAVARVDAQHLGGPLQAVAQRGDVDVQAPGGVLEVSAAVEVDRQRPLELGAVRAVVVRERLDVAEMNSTMTSGRVDCRSMLSRLLTRNEKTSSRRPSRRRRSRPRRAARYESR